MSVALSEQLPLLATAPDGIQKLRGLILELAVRGKLVPQDPRDEPASELLKRIVKEKARQVAEGKIRKSLPLASVSEDEYPFKLPKGWEWIRLGQIGNWGAGATPLRSNSHFYGGSIPWFKSGELTADFISESEEHITELALQKCSLRLNQPGDVLIAMYGATIGKTAILSVAATTNQAVCACTPNAGVDNCFLLLLLRALKPNFVGQGAGGAQPNISREKIIATIAALPPEAEQHRIVAKVDELMALCDRLEAEQADADAAHAKLVEILLATLTQSRDADELATNWQRLSQHFDTLFNTESSLDVLKQTILQFAVMGKLVPRDPKRIAVAGKLADVAEFLNGYAFKSGWFTKTGVRLLRNANVAHGNCDWKDAVHIPSDSVAEFDKFTLSSGDLVLSLDRPIIKTGLKFARITASDLPCLLLQRVAKVSPKDSLVTTDYLFLWFNSPHFMRTINPGRSNGVPHISTKQVGGIPFVRYSIAEQNNIVAKVDQLMGLCDQLKADLAESRNRQERLSATLIEFALKAA